MIDSLIEEAAYDSGLKGRLTGIKSRHLGKNGGRMSEGVKVALEKILYAAPGNLASKAPYNARYTPPGYEWCGTPQSGFWSYQFKDDEINPDLSDT